jgi:shikimate dehydrogenase
MSERVQPTTSPGQRLIDLQALKAYTGRPLYLFIGIDTGGSRVHESFPAWASALNIDAQLRGIDLPTDLPAERWRELVTVMRDNPMICGAVITSHKLRLYRFCEDLFDKTDTLVGLTHEVNSLDTRDGVHAFARDAQSLYVLLHSQGSSPVAGWHPTVCIGSGGSAIALLLAHTINVSSTLTTGQVVPASVPDTALLTVVGCRHASLEGLIAVADRTGAGQTHLRTALASSPEACAEMLAEAAPGTLVINATGLGKSDAESPLPGPQAFPAEAIAWDFNYRGPLTFLAQAHEAKVTAEDGWEYFLAGWACAIAAITGQDPERALAALQSISPHPARQT